MPPRLVSHLFPKFLDTSGRAGCHLLQWHCSRTVFARNSHTLPKSILFESLIRHDPSCTAVIHSKSGERFTYGNLLHDVVEARDRLISQANTPNLQGERVAFLMENGYDYVVTLLSIIANGAIALPIATGFPHEETKYILENSAASMVLTTKAFEEKVKDVVMQDSKSEPEQHLVSEIQPHTNRLEEIRLNDQVIDTGGLMLYTSGTTSRPKGVVLSTSVITAQALSLIEAWQYKPSDVLLHVLPLHHIHGTVNALYTPLIAGATVEFLFPFNPSTIWQRFAAPFENPSSSNQQPAVSFFTVVPTIYSRLLSTFSQLDEKTKKAASEAVSPRHLRLNISGSAALPVPTKNAWTKLSGGNVLLERYGMTEVGMALSCGLDYKDRVDGSVGWPLPSVEVRLVDTETGAVIEPGEELDASGQSREGEIQLRGPTVFAEYWQNPKATADEFVDAQDGAGRWFKTGDVAIRQEVPTSGSSEQSWAKGPLYFIKGRKSVDIIKTGGEKVSALEVERELLSLPEIAEAAVVGVHSEQWGQKVSAVVVLTDDGKRLSSKGKPWGPMDMRRALKNRLSSYKIPQDLVIVDGIPRNAMGKINKKALVKKLYPEQ